MGEGQGGVGGRPPCYGVPGAPAIPASPPPSPPGSFRRPQGRSAVPRSFAKLFLESASAKSPPWSSTVLARVVRHALFGVPTRVVHQVPASVVRRPRRSRLPSPPGSLAKLSVAPPVPAVLALGDKGTQFYYCAPWLAVWGLGVGGWGLGVGVVVVIVVEVVVVPEVYTCVNIYTCT